MNLLADAPVVDVKPINLRTLLVVIAPPIGSPLYVEGYLTSCLNEFANASDNLSGWRAYVIGGRRIEIYLHGNIDWEGGRKWL